MAWNWEQTDWPTFRWDAGRLEEMERAFLRNAGVFVGMSKHLSHEDRDVLIIESLSDEAMTTSEIEGETLDRASVQSSIRKQLGLVTDDRRAPAAEQGIAEMMVDLYRSFDHPLSDETLFTWHRMLVGGRRDLTDVGRYRTQTEPMQVVSKALHEPRVHFEAPPSPRMEAEMARFMGWFNSTAPGGAAPLPKLTRSGIAHLYFVSIHPFEDGNGRIGRAISEKALVQGAGQPSLTALATTILAQRRAYYQALEQASKGNDVTDWLVWFAKVTHEAQQRTLAFVSFLLAKTRLLGRLQGQLNQRQEKALLRMFREGPSGFKGGLSAGNYMTITQATSATTTRDLAELVAKGALIRTGERRYARYSLKLD